MQSNIVSHDPTTSSPCRLFLVAALGASLLALGACDQDSEDLDDLDRAAELEDLDAEADALADPASAPQPLTDDEPVLDRSDAALDLTAAPDVQAYTWKSWISEEQAASTCGTGHLVTGFDCDGPFCDNVRIECHNSGGTLGESYWSKWVSEEGPHNFYQCPGSQYVTGMTCSGAFCDNLSLECTDTTLGKTGCAWAGPYSEEQPPYYAPYGKAIAGVWCTGAYCDNKYYWVCNT